MKKLLKKQTTNANPTNGQKISNACRACANRAN
jgi:hypothetical protein